MILLRPLILLLGLLAVWEAMVHATGVPGFLLPPPSEVIQVLFQRLDFLLMHGGWTLLKILAGLVIGTVIGAMSALALSYIRPLRSWLLPVLIASQAIPVFVLAPVLVNWFGYNIASNIVMAVLIIYFPVTATFYDGLRRTEPGWIDLARTMGADRLAILKNIRLPAALPAFASGLKVAASVAPIGAVVGEWVGTPNGLGRVMLDANQRIQTDLMFAALFLLAVIAVLVYLACDQLGRRIVYWQQESD